MALYFGATFPEVVHRTTMIKHGSWQQIKTVNNNKKKMILSLQHVPHHPLEVGRGPHRVRGIRGRRQCPRRHSRPQQPPLPPRSLSVQMQPAEIRGVGAESEPLDPQVSCVVGVEKYY
ncbi:hypothetical protein Acr_03g0003010 [Actinidia rufa]|uniref:Uncharacterized protein n=1 Tax=Actinidia rufa TaxID=165716 RepID=A0A7J0ED17_9ERIC|nr:hypothetical protein Acr_03g0003010 [Actinidia rufa]